MSQRSNEKVDYEQTSEANEALLNNQTFNSNLQNSIGFSTQKHVY